jgi:hypothetical protein
MTLQLKEIVDKIDLCREAVETVLKINSLLNHNLIELLYLVWGCGSDFCTEGHLNEFQDKILQNEADRLDEYIMQKAQHESFQVLADELAVLRQVLNKHGKELLSNEKGTLKVTATEVHKLSRQRKAEQLEQVKGEINELLDQLETKKGLKIEEIDLDKISEEIFFEIQNSVAVDNVESFLISLEPLKLIHNTDRAKLSRCLNKLLIDKIFKSFINNFKNLEVFRANWTYFLEGKLGLICSEFICVLENMVSCLTATQKWQIKTLFNESFSLVADKFNLLVKCLEARRLASKNDTSCYM